MTISSTTILKNLLLFILLVAGLYYAKSFLMPLAVGGVLATLFLPLCRWLELKKVPSAIAVMLCVLILLAVVAGVVGMLGWQVSALTGDFEKIKEKSISISFQVQEYIFTHLGVSAEKQSELLSNEQPSITGIFQLVSGSLAYIFANFVLILVYIFCLLYYREHLKQVMLKLTAPAQRSEMEQIIYGASRVSQQYLVGLAKMIVCLWIMYSIGFGLLGVKNFLFFAILCGLLEIVPFIGNLTGTSITVLVAIVQGASTPLVIGIICTYGLIQFIQGWILEPLIVGPQVKINPFATILALILGEIVWGIPGIFLAIPLVAMFKIVCDHIEPLKPYGFFIGEIKDQKNESLMAKKLDKWVGIK